QPSGKNIIRWLLKKRTNGSVRYCQYTSHIRTRETYGTRRLQTELAENGIIVGRDRLARLRKELRLRCKQKRKFRATTNSNHNLPVAPNLLNQTFAPTAPNQVWVADLTYVAT
ncbi:IS3 family transposase, partial [Escherichia coli]|uniref:IS3 family transposase n=1 Tax=Escherichia coli TaxID=562 RepID=UPI00207B1E58